MQLVEYVDSIKCYLVEKKLISSAQMSMIPSIRVQQKVNTAKNAHPKPSSVLILLIERDEKICFIVTQRQEYGGVHSGQISLPGGKFEKNDENLEKTALRETFEEIGIDSNKIEIIGRLSDLFIPPSNFNVTPFVGVFYDSPKYHPDKLEVAKIIEVPIDDLLDKTKVKTKYFTSINGNIEAPYFDVQGVEIWGATAMILAEFKAVISDIMNKD